MVNPLAAFITKTLFGGHNPTNQGSSLPLSPPATHSLPPTDLRTYNDRPPWWCDNDYQSKSAEEKQAILWSKAEAQEGTQGDALTDFETLKALWNTKYVFAESASDQTYLPKGRTSKATHYIGSLVQATLVPSNSSSHPFTGLFRYAPYLLVRMSHTKTPSKEEGTTPSIAIKLLRDGLPSANIVAMYSLEGHLSGNYFHGAFSNHVEFAKTWGLKLVDYLNGRSSKPQNMVGLSNVARTTIEGTTVEDPVFPYEIKLRPNPVLTDQFRNAKWSDDLGDSLIAITAGTMLYTLLGRVSPSSTEWLEIGTIETTSRVIGHSKFVDDEYNVAHQRMSEDLKLMPQWGGKDMSTTTTTTTNGKCPFSS